jgi:hypothetical protein
MVSILLVLYLIACAVCGIMGRRTMIGFMGHFLVAFFFSPVLDFLVLAVSRSSVAEVSDGTSGST